MKSIHTLLAAAAAVVAGSNYSDRGQEMKTMALEYRPDPIPVSDYGFYRLRSTGIPHNGYRKSQTAVRKGRRRRFASGTVTPSTNIAGTRLA